MMRIQKTTILLLLILGALLGSARVATGFGQTDPIIIISHRGLLTDTYYMIFGEIKNNGTTAVTDVRIGVESFDEDNALLDSGNATAFLVTILPGRRSPFIRYVSSANFRNVRNYSLGNIFYTTTDAKPQALALQNYYYYNGTLQTHVLNNSTGSFRKATNNIKVIGSLYLNETIVGVATDFFNFDSPGLMWDTDTSGVGGGDPAVLEFMGLFNVGEVENATELVMTVESKDFVAEQEVILNLLVPPSQGGSPIVYEWAVVASVFVLGAAFLLKIRHDKRKRRAHVKSESDLIKHKKHLLGRTGFGKERQ